MKNFKGIIILLLQHLFSALFTNKHALMRYLNSAHIIMSEYTSQLTIMRHFPKIFSMIHMPPKPMIAVLAATLHYFYVRNSYFNSKYTPKLEYLVPFFQNFPGEIYIYIP